MYKLWGRLLRHWRTPYKKHGRFDIHNDLKWYLLDAAKDDDPPSDAIYVDPKSFVKFVVIYLDEAL